MQPTKELIDALFREEIERAREMTPDEKLLAGPELFGFARRLMADGLRNENPGADEETIDRLLGARLELVRRLEAGD